MWQLNNLSRRKVLILEDAGKEKITSDWWRNVREEFILMKRQLPTKFGRNIVHKWQYNTINDKNII